MRNPREIVGEVLGGQHLRVADVGAANGLPAHVQVLEGNAHWYLFEPHPESAEALQRRYASGIREGALRIIRTPLSGKGGQRVLFVTNAPTGTSLLRPASEYGVTYSQHGYFFPCREVSVETQSLAAVLDTEGIAYVDFIKLDVQGAELEVLAGLDASRLERLLGVETEIGLLGGYQGQPGYGEIEDFLRSSGFELFDLKAARTHRPHEGDYEHYSRRLGASAHSPSVSMRIWEVDAVFFRRPGPLLERKDSDAVRRLLALYCTYGFFGEALSLVDSARNAGVLAPEAARAVDTAVVAWHRVLAFHAYYGAMPYRILRRLGSMAHRALRLVFGRSAPRWGG